MKRLIEEIRHIQYRLLRIKVYFILNYGRSEDYVQFDRLYIVDISKNIPTSTQLFSIRQKYNTENIWRFCGKYMVLK